jgi:hypothetical protein
VDAVEGLELFPEITLQRIPVVNVRAVGIFEPNQRLNKTILNIVFLDR